MLVINMTWLTYVLAPQIHISSQKYDSKNFKLTLKIFGFSAEREKKKVIKWQILDNIPNNPTNPYDPNNLKYVYQTCIVHKSCQIHANHPNNPNRPMTLITLIIFENF